jgi:hypothetical protein
MRLTAEGQINTRVSATSLFLRHTELLGYLCFTKKTRIKERRSHKRITGLFQEVRGFCRYQPSRRATAVASLYGALAACTNCGQTLVGGTVQSILRGEHLNLWRVGVGTRPVASDSRMQARKNHLRIRRWRTVPETICIFPLLALEGVCLQECVARSTTSLARWRSLRWFRKHRSVMQLQAARARLAVARPWAPLALVPLNLCAGADRRLRRLKRLVLQSNNSSIPHPYKPALSRPSPTALSHSRSSSLLRPP